MSPNAVIISLSILSAILPSIILIWYFRRQDRFPEPIGIMMMTFFLGVLSVIPILVIAVSFQSWPPQRESINLRSTTGTFGTIPCMRWSTPSW